MRQTKSSKPFVVGLIPARGGSKGILDKNIRLVAGKPLIAYTIEAAQKSRYISKLILSTDSQKIANVAKRSGLETDALRPAHLATDRAKTLDVVRYELGRLQKKLQRPIDFVVLLQPTAPLRTAKDIDEACAMFLKNKKNNSLVSVCDVGGMHPKVMYVKRGDHLVPFLETGGRAMRRQNFEAVYARNGALYLFTPKQATQGDWVISKRPLMYLMPRERSVNIDESLDLEIAEFFVRRAR
ncbi:MAG: acylneuraminate cytidylyltransferase family protein [bacterium]|nr:acylneuraminate cytidylyltransferase family protein [bacterium]